MVVVERFRQEAAWNCVAFPDSKLGCGEARVLPMVGPDACHFVGICSGGSGCTIAIGAWSFVSIGMLHRMALVFASDSLSFAPVRGQSRRRLWVVVGGRRIPQDGRVRCRNSPLDRPWNPSALFLLVQAAKQSISPKGRGWRESWLVV
jgi:hypothetical protein